MSESKLAYIRVFGVPEVDEYNKGRLLSTIDEEMEIELFEDKSARGLQEYLEFPPERLYINEYVIMNMLISTIHDINKIQSPNEIYSTLEHEVNLFALLEFSGINTSDVLRKDVYREYLKDFIGKVIQYKPELI